MSDNDEALNDLHDWAATALMAVGGRSYKIKVTHHENDIEYTIELWSCDLNDVATVVYGYGDTLAYATDAALASWPT